MSKEPQLVLNSIYAFPPNRHTLGGTAYLIVKKHGNILIDCPIWDESSAAFVHRLGGVSQLVITHRDGLSDQLPKLQSALGCTIIIQEQEAYRVPQSLPIETFQQERTWPDGDRMMWTPGHSPGSSCFYEKSQGILFSGRHLLPNKQGLPTPVKIPKTFHWPRQKQNVQRLLDLFNEDNLNYILPGGRIGWLRGDKCIDQAYSKLAQLQLADLKMDAPK